MQKEKRVRKKVAGIRIEPYLAQYIKIKYTSDPVNGGVRIPPSTDLYHCVWENMSRSRADSFTPCDANLFISLPARRTLDDQSWKDPAYFNHLSVAAARHIERCIRRLFRYELHRVLMENEESGRKVTTQQMVHDFIIRYRLQDLITDDALIKNFQRFKQKIHRKTPRKYEKTKKNAAI